MGCLGSILGLRSSRTCCSSLATTRASPPSRLPAGRTQAASSRSWDEYETVSFLMLPRAPRRRSSAIDFAVNSIVLLTNGVSFALQAAVLLLVGAWADYGRWR